MANENKNAFDILAVTNVQVFPQNDTRIKAFANVVLNDQLIIRGLTVKDGENGLFVAYPFDPFFKGEEFRLLVVPVTRALRDHVEAVVIEKYQDAVKKENG